MLTTSILGVAAALALGVHAQSATTTSSSAGATYTIAVGAEGFKFSPNNIKNASIGDVLEFRFYPGGHTVARSDFGRPCIPYEYLGLNRQGFYSGQKSPQVITSNLPSFSVRINDTDPIWFYCTAPGSCYEHQMIGVVNARANETFDQQMQYATNATFQLTPGDPWPSETAKPSTTAGATATATATPATSNDAGTSSHSLSVGAIAGIAIGGAAVVIIAAALIYLCGRRGGLDKAYRRSTHTFPPPTVEPKYGPKSPGQETVSTAHYSMPPHDPYHSLSPHQYMHTPPPLSPSHPAYNTYSGHPGAHSPLMGTGTMDSSPGYYPGVTPPPELHAQQAHHYQAGPVELPTSENPGNSPLPRYQPQRENSWNQGAETQYRPGSKA